MPPDRGGTGVEPGWNRVPPGATGCHRVPPDRGGTGCHPMPHTQVMFKDFVESEPRVRKAFYGGGERAYVSLLCPHCKVVCAEIPENRISSHKSKKCREHLTKCPGYGCPPCDKKEASVLVVHEKCIEEREVLEQKLDTMTDQLSQQRKELSEQMQKQADSIIAHADKRWSSFATVMVQRFPSLKEPVNDETIPTQMLNRERSLLLRDESERSATKKEIAQLKMINTGLLESQTVLNDKYKALLTEKDKHVPFSQYLRKVDQLEAEISRLREAALRSGKRARPSKKPCA